MGPLPGASVSEKGGESGPRPSGAFSFRIGGRQLETQDQLIRNGIVDGVDAAVDGMDGAVDGNGVTDGAVGGGAGILVLLDSALLYLLLFWLH